MSQAKTLNATSAIDSTVCITRTLILKIYVVINESCVINSNSDYRIDPIEHHLKDTINLNREIESRVGIVRTPITDQ